MLPANRGSLTAVAKQSIWVQAVGITLGAASAIALVATVTGNLIDHWDEIIRFLTVGFWFNLLGSWACSAVVAVLFVAVDIDEKQPEQLRRWPRTPYRFSIFAAPPAIMAVLLTLAHWNTLSEAPRLTTAQVIFIGALWVTTVVTVAITGILFWMARYEDR